MHFTSLPATYGIGDVGPEAYRFVDLLKRAGATWWQVLPLTPPATAESPYCSTSTFAGNPLLISPDLLRRDGLLTSRELPAAHLPEGSVDYPAARSAKERLLATAHERFTADRAASRLRDAFSRFCHEESWWLDDFALYCALCDSRRQQPWSAWEKPLRERRALHLARNEHTQIIERIRFEQFIFCRQMTALHDYASANGIHLMGDVPIYVDLNSSDVWSRPEQFKLRPDGRPRVIAGVPPDYFSKDGQLWGNPLYNWNAMRKDGFNWWTRRIRHLLRYVDVVRIDHFRGLEACWEVPAGAKTARSGHWVPSPGAELLHRLQQELGHPLPLVAEDLGTITPAVEKLRDDFALPGMRILQFAFDSGPSSTMLPHHYPRNVLAYTGTHDNDTTLSWYRRMPSRSRAYLRSYVPDAQADPVGALIRLAMSSVANLAIIPLQDILRLGAEGRMNLPGTVHGNWAWRVRSGQLRPQTFAEFRRLAETYGRIP